MSAVRFVLRYDVMNISLCHVIVWFRGQSIAMK